VYLLDSEYLINVESQEIHLLTSGTLPEVGAVFTVPFSQNDTGVAFTVNTCGAGAFILNTTTDIFLTVNTLSDARHAPYLLVSLSERGTHFAQKSHKHFNRERKSCFSGIKLQRRTILRL
jgi:hypothetical protein